MLVGQIIAHRTKLNPWEFVATKVCIMSLVVPNIKHVASIVNLILTLGWDTLGESNFFFFFLGSDWSAVMRAEPAHALTLRKPSAL